MPTVQRAGEQRIVLRNGCSAESRVLPGFPVDSLTELVLHLRTEPQDTLLRTFRSRLA